ncbi:unnamed protein product, partial [Prorocentrum cordatum]
AGRREAAPIRAPVPRAARSGALEERPPPHRLQLARRAARPCGQGRRGAQGHRARGARSHAAAACGREGEARAGAAGARAGQAVIAEDGAAAPLAMPARARSL